MDSIVARKVESGRVYYKVHWAGYSARQDSWEPQSALVRCRDMIDAYMKSQVKYMCMIAAEATYATRKRCFHAINW